VERVRPRSDSHYGCRKIDRHERFAASACFRKNLIFLTMMNPVAFPNGPFLILLAILTGTAAGTLAQDDAPAEPPEKQSTDPPSDRAIAERVQGVIAAQNSSGFDHVDVAVENQIVTLSGRVGSLAVRERAVDLARHVLGAGAVVDQILVQPPDVDDVDRSRRRSPPIPLWKRFRFPSPPHGAKLG